MARKSVEAPLRPRTKVRTARQVVETVTIRQQQTEIVALRSGDHAGPRAHGAMIRPGDI
jgi:hypothetical protein